jgi:hypothetical protein
MIATYSSPGSIRRDEGSMDEPDPAFAVSRVHDLFRLDAWCGHPDVHSARVMAASRQHLRRASD